MAFLACPNWKSLGSTPSPHSSLGWRRSVLPERRLRTGMRDHPETRRLSTHSLILCASSIVRTARRVKLSLSQKGERLIHKAARLFLLRKICLDLLLSARNLCGLAKSHDVGFPFSRFDLLAIPIVLLSKVLWNHVGPELSKGGIRQGTASIRIPRGNTLTTKRWHTSHQGPAAGQYLRERGLGPSVSGFTPPNEVASHRLNLTIFSRFS